MTGLLDDFEEMVSISLPLRDVEYLGFKMDLSPEIAVAQVIHRAAQQKAHSNGHGVEGFKSVCSSCGNEYASVHRPKPGRRNYCTECREAGEPAADRQRDYRDRRRQEVQS